MSPFILDWPTAAAAGATLAGGKGWQLGLLAEFGVRVPDGFVLAAQCSRDHRPGTPVPEPVLAAVARELDRRGWSNRPLAVRSSAAQEDSHGTSFAGIHSSRLNVRGVDAVAEAIRTVWDSAWSEAATAYRARLELEDGNRAMAVMIMPLLPARASGVAFTCDPATGRDDQVLINAHWGLGEALVGGAADGDVYRLQGSHLHPHLHETERRIGTKRRQTRLADGGTELCDTPPGLAAQAVLSAEQAVQLGHMVRDAAAALDYARPFYDVEWLWDGERFWIVQARPVTALGRHTYAGLRGQPALWSRGNTREVLPDPLSPVDWDSSKMLVNRMLGIGWKLAGLDVLPGIQRAALFHGRLYLEASAIQWEAYDALGIPPAVINALMGGHHPEIAVPPAGLGDRLRRLGNLLRYIRRSAPIRRRADRTLRAAHKQAAAWRRETLPADNGALAALIQRRRDVVGAADDLMFLQGSGGGGLSQLVRMLEKHFPGQGHSLAAALMAGGEPSITARQGFELVELARIAAEEDPEALAWLRAPGRHSAGWRTALPGHSRFRAAFAAFLDAYGHRAVKETYLRMPRWREQPDYLLDVVVGLVGTDGAALRKRPAEAAATAWARVRNGVPPWLRPMVRHLVRTANTECNHREAARSALIAYLEVARQDLLEVARRLGGPDGLERPDDVFNLTAQELLATSDGRLSRTFAARRAAARRRRLEQWAVEQEPEFIALHGGGGTGSPLEPAHPTADGAWTGTAVGAGLARGHAHVAHQPGDGSAMATGAILVAPSTDPAWTPLFLKAGGLVMETGGYLSHGAIVAREFGIPAVVNLPGILAQVEAGALLEVDGDGGRVRRLTTPPAE